MITLKQIIESGMDSCNVYDTLHNYQISNPDEFKELIKFYNTDYKNGNYKIRISNCHMDFNINKGKYWCTTTKGSFRIEFDDNCHIATFDICFTLTNNCRRRYNVSAMRHKQTKKADRLMWRNAFK
jgi:hypothetical protein